jgi:hypothetical protein
VSDQSGSRIRSKSTYEDQRAIISQDRTDSPSHAADGAALYGQQSWRGGGGGGSRIIFLT